MRPGVLGIDLVVGVLADAILADERLQQPVGVADVIEAEAALDAEPLLVRRAVAAIDIEQLIILDLVGELAADAAIGADAIDFAVGSYRQHAGLVDQRLFHQGAGRAGLDAFAAGNASAVAHRIVEIENDLGVGIARRHADHVIDLDLAAGADAEIAFDAGVEPDRHRRMAAVGGGLMPMRSAQRQNFESGSGWWARSG